MQFKNNSSSRFCSSIGRTSGTEYIIRYNIAGLFVDSAADIWPPFSKYFIFILIFYFNVKLLETSSPKRCFHEHPLPPVISQTLRKQQHILSSSSLFSHETWSGALFQLCVIYDFEVNICNFRSFFFYTFQAFYC